jgi:hypothetical protein
MYVFHTQTLLFTTSYRAFHICSTIKTTIEMRMIKNVVVAGVSWTFLVLAYYPLLRFIHTGLGELGSRHCSRSSCRQLHCHHPLSSYIYVQFSIWRSCPRYTNRLLACLAQPSPLRSGCSHLDTGMGSRAECSDETSGCCCCEL